MEEGEVEARLVGRVRVARPAAARYMRWAICNCAWAICVKNVNWLRMSGHKRPT